MTRNQYYKLAEDFARYANKEVEFTFFSASTTSKGEQLRGILKGIGMGANDENIIIAHMGYRYAVHYDYVKFPRG